MISFCKDALGVIVEYSTPFSAPCNIIAWFSGLYVHQIVLTYAPGQLASLCIAGTAWLINNKVIGVIFGAAIVAPWLTPKFTIILAYGLMALTSYLVLVLCNIIARHLFGIVPGK